MIFMKILLYISSFIIPQKPHIKTNFSRMNLIQLLNAKESKNNDILFALTKQIFEIFENISILYRSQSQIQISFVQDKKSCHYLFTKILINLEYNLIHIRSSLFSHLICKVQSQYQKTILLRMILKIIDKKLFYSFKMNPITGQIVIQHSYILSRDFNFSIFNQLILDCIQKISFENIKDNSNIFQFMSNYSKEQLISDEQNKIFENFKSYINCSSYYAWFVLTNQTKTSKTTNNFYIYPDTKKEFTSMQKNQVQHYFFKMLSQSYKTKLETKKINFFNQEEDKVIYNRFLAQKPVYSNGQKQINEITVSEQILKTIDKNIDIKLNTHENKTSLFVRINKSKQSWARMHQQTILDKFPDAQFLNLPKYYKVKNNKQFNQKWQITNLYESIQFDHYLYSNKEVMSIFTKIGIVYQISNCLKYFRDLNTVYHNLLPTNIFIKKGLIVKLIDLSNAYNITIINKNKEQTNVKTPPYNKYPYILNIRNGQFRSIDDERSDVFSFGIFLYQIIFGKHYSTIKQSHVKLLSQQQKFFKLLKLNLTIYQSICYQRHQILKLILNLIQKCTEHEYEQNKIDYYDIFDQQEFDDVDDKFKTMKRLENRPYLDWIVVITKQIYNYYHKILI